MTAPAPEPVDPRIIWFFDSSKQILVFRDLERNVVVGFAEKDIVKSGWNMDGIRFSIPRVKVEGGPR